MRHVFSTGLAAVLLAGCGGSDSRVYDESDADQAAAAIARGEDDVTIRSEDGEVRVRSGDTGEPLPGGLPAYPGADRTGGYSATSDGSENGRSQMVSFESDDSPAEVIAFYREMIEDSGRTVRATMDMGEMQSISVADEDERGGLMITATGDGNGTTIMMVDAREGE